jgi:hypothetical protein
VRVVQVHLELDSTKLKAQIMPFLNYSATAQPLTVVISAYGKAVVGLSEVRPLSNQETQLAAFILVDQMVRI